MVEKPAVAAAAPFVPLGAEPPFVKPWLTFGLAMTPTLPGPGSHQRWASQCLLCGKLLALTLKVVGVTQRHVHPAQHLGDVDLVGDLLRRRLADQLEHLLVELDVLLAEAVADLVREAAIVDKLREVDDQKLRDHVAVDLVIDLAPSTVLATR